MNNYNISKLLLKYEYNREKTKEFLSSLDYYSIYKLSIDLIDFINCNSLIISDCKEYIERNKIKYDKNVLQRIKVIIINSSFNALYMCDILLYIATYANID